LVETRPSTTVLSSGTSPSALNDPEREARLEKALTELKKSLKEILPGLRKEL